MKTDRIYSLYDDISEAENEGNEGEDEEEYDAGQSTIPNEKKWLKVSDFPNTFMQVHGGRALSNIGIGSTMEQAYC